MENIRFLSAGAAESLVELVRSELEERYDIGLSGHFGAVRAMKGRFLQGEPCELFISSEAVIEELVEEGFLAGPIRDLGLVYTGVAVPQGSQWPAMSNETELSHTLRSARKLYFPDPVRATAGIHFAKVLAESGIALNDIDFDVYPNGRTAMRALAQSTGPGQLGCTQVTEILQTDGIELVGLLPGSFELATRYQCAVVRNASHRAAMARDFLTGRETSMRREKLGFKAEAT